MIPWHRLAAALRDLARHWPSRIPGDPGPFLDAVRDADLRITPDGPEAAPHRPEEL